MTLTYIIGCHQLQQMLLKLVKESFGDGQYKKSLDCLRALRRECIQVHVHVCVYGAGRECMYVCMGLGESVYRAGRECIVCVWGWERVHVCVYGAGRDCVCIGL